MGFKINREKLSLGSNFVGWKFCGVILGAQNFDMENTGVEFAGHLLAIDIITGTMTDQVGQKVI